MKTGVASDELKGRLPALKDWTQSTSYYMAIGQGFSVTPIQLVSQQRLLSTVEKYSRQL